MLTRNTPVGDGDIERETFPAKTIRALLQQSRTVRNRVGRGPDGWTVSKLDPTRVVDCFSPALRVKPSYILSAYVFRSGENGNGRVHAVPKGMKLLPPGKEYQDLFMPPRLPPEALQNFMDAIEPDGSLLAYISASLLARELCEFGARWHGEAWGFHEVIGGAPWLDFAEPPGNKEHERKEEPEVARLCSGPDGWDAELPPPPLLDPVVQRGTLGVQVTFHTHAVIEKERVLRHVDFFEPGSLVAATKTTILAKGSMMAIC
jgi:hypothetical protein